MDQITNVPASVSRILHKKIHPKYSNFIIFGNYAKMIKLKIDIVFLSLLMEALKADVDSLRVKCW